MEFSFSERLWPTSSMLSRLPTVSADAIYAIRADRFFLCSGFGEHLQAQGVDISHWNHLERKTSYTSYTGLFFEGVS